MQGPPRFLQFLGLARQSIQPLAGQIPNGVFVVMDHVELPSFGPRPGSFSAWSSSFISIVEGLRALDGEAVPDPTRTPA